MDAMTKVLIKGGMRVIKLPGPTGVMVIGTIEVGALGTVGPATALGSSSMSVTAWQEEHAE